MDIYLHKVVTVFFVLAFLASSGSAKTSSWLLEVVRLDLSWSVLQIKQSFFFFNLKPPVDLNNVTMKLKKKIPYILHVIILKKQIDFQHDDRNKMTIIFQWNYTLRSSNLVLAAVEGNRKTFWLKFHLFASTAAHANEMMLLQSTSAWWLDKILSGPRLESHFQKHYYSK